ncbi:hypothetical protein CK203_073732 [Vitis vinifera]|uniref:Reverse transcriptase zinc-binding domain-containing protein n=1 Tax=Vitis vinifera TaxID=29760 RepID=A0A438EIQ8_VITVI|nr:hypothetical protein CK203_073732 [Vitis vinifera]
MENAEILALELRCKVGVLLTSYLGLPLGALYKSVAVWYGVEERFRKRLAIWERQFISKGGRVDPERLSLGQVSFGVEVPSCALEPGFAILFLRSIIWSLCVPPKVGFFAWEASWGKTLTLDQLKRRG